MKKVRAPARVLRIAPGSSYEASGFRSKKVRGAALNADDQPLAAARLHQASRDLAPDGAGGAGDPEYHVFVMCQVYLVSPPRSPTFGETLCFSEARRSYEPSWGRDGLNNETSYFPSRIPRHRVHESTNYDFPGIS
jgi:hypothetical protein